MKVLPHLSDLASEHGTDKGPRFHSYTEFYHELLSPIRNAQVSFLEIGVDGGESIRMWDSFFTHQDTRIYGVDIHDKGVSVGKKGKFILGDATQPNLIFDITNETGPLDVIVDDGSHYSEDQKKAIESWWPHLKPGGIYCVEDVFTSFTYPWTKPDDVSFVAYTMGWINKVHENGADHCGKPKSTDVDEIIIRKGLHIFRKRC